MAAPKIEMTKALAAGSARIIFPDDGILDNNFPPYTKARPAAVSAPANPRLKATIRTSPYPTRFIEIAASITTRADEQGIIPPDTPSASRFRHVTSEPSAPGGKCV